MGFALEPPLRRLMTPTGRLNLRVGCRMRPKPLGTFPRVFLCAVTGSRESPRSVAEEKG
jgi:hypothetical protein